MGPFEGLRVIDLSPNRVGAQTSQVFADFGADVIQVEPPGGAVIRQHAAYPFWARGKRSIVLDLTSADDRDTLRNLASVADVFIETYPPGVLDGLGLGADSLCAANPRLIHTSVTGFGTSGPLADIPGYEALVMAKLGMFSAFRFMSPHDEPPFVNVPFASFAASQVAVHGILAALLVRESTGLGQQVDTSLIRAVTSLDTWTWFTHLIQTRYSDAFSQADAYDDEGRPMSPLAFMLLVGLTSDGAWLQFACVAPHLFLGEMESLGLMWMFTDPEWEGIPMFPGRPDKSAELWSRMLEAVRSKSLAEWEQIFADNPNVFAEQFRSGPTVLEHPQLVHDNCTIDVVDAAVGPVRQPGPIVRLAKTPAEPPSSAPTLDQDRAAILELAGSVQPGAAPGSGVAADGGLPLAGITVLELATMFAAPHGTTMLTDLGARVIKVEPLAGDMIRHIMPFPEIGAAKVMQGKESLAVDMSTDEGKAIVRQIASTADVVIQGYRAGAMAKMGLDYAGIVATNPDVVYVNAPGYGVDGPYGSKPAYAPSIGAATGIPLANVGPTIPSVTADLTTEGIKHAGRRLAAASAVPNAQADGFAALGVTSAILIGLAARARGHGGQELFSSMLNTGAHAMSAQTVTYPGAPVEPGPDARLRGLGTLYQVYDTADGTVFLAAPSADDWAHLAAALAPHVDLAADERFVDAASRNEHHEALAEALASVFVTQDAQAWEDELRPAGVGCVKVNDRSVEWLLFGEIGRSGGFVADVVHPTFDEHPRLTPYLNFSRSTTQALPGVLAGQQTDSLLTEFGKSADEIADLRERSIVGG